jgi:hypothetical protein
MSCLSGFYIAAFIPSQKAGHYGAFFISKDQDAKKNARGNPGFKGLPSKPLKILQN